MFRLLRAFFIEFNSMKKTIIIGITLLLAGLLYYHYSLSPKLGIMTGYSAKILCSCHFVSGMDQEEIEAIDLGFGPLWLATNRIDKNSKRVYSSVLGLQKKTAIYREGLGCTLIHDRSIAEVERDSFDRASLQFAASKWPGHEVKPEGALWDAMLQGFDKEGEQVLNTRALLVVKNGEIIGEMYGPGFDYRSKLPGWSMMKSVSAAFVGLLIRDGLLDPDAPAPIKEWKDDERSKISLRHLVNMCSGLDWEEDYTTVSTATTMLYSRDDMGTYAASVPIKHEPGSHWYYSSGTSNILTRICAEALGGHDAFRQYAYKELFEPLGMRDFLVETDASGSFVGSSYGYGSARDWAKFALLHLRQGNWYGQEILDSSWVKFCTTPISESGGRYGGQFWCNGDGGFANYAPNAYWLGGFQGKQVSVHPDEDLIVVRIGVTYDTGTIDFDSLIGGVILAARDQESHENKPEEEVEKAL